MPITLVDTPGAADANTYASLTFADDYNVSRPFGEKWAAADIEKRKAALIQATMLEDAAFPWTGAAVNNTQVLSFPRTGMLSRNGFPIQTDVIPVELKRATSEFAGHLLLSNRLADNDATFARLRALKVGSVGLDFDLPAMGTSGNLESRDADVIRAGPEFNWLSRAIPDSVRLLIPGSWYTRETISMPIIFDVSR